MERLRAALRKVFCPRGWLLGLLLPVSAISLAAVFTKGQEETAFAYLAYAVSAYTLAAAVLRLVRLARSGGTLLRKNALFRRYRDDAEWRAEVSLSLSLAVNVVYALYKAAAGLYYRSAWFGTAAFYYIVLGTVRFLLLHHLRKRQYDRQRELKQYRFCGYLLLVLTVAIAGMGFWVIGRGAGAKYPGYMIYAAAAFTFYSFGLAVANLLRYRRQNRPVYTAGKMIALATALVSMFSLQTAMFASFGSGGMLERQMNLASGCAVFALVAGMAVFMIWNSGRRGRTG